MAFDKIKDKLSKPSMSLRGVDDAVSKLSAAAHEKTHDAIEGLLKEVDDLLPLLQDGGFRVDAVTLTLSVPPAVGIVIEQEEKTPSRLKEVLARADLTRTQSMALKAIERIYGLSHVIEKYGHTIDAVEVEISVPPSVKAYLRRGERITHQLGSPDEPEYLPLRG